MVPEPLGLKSEDQALADLLVALRLGVTGDGDEEIGVARGWRALSGGAAAARGRIGDGPAVRAAARAPASGAAGGTTRASARAAIHTGVARAPAGGRTTVAPPRAPGLGRPRRSPLARRAPTGPGARATGPDARATGPGARAATPGARATGPGVRAAAPGARAAAPGVRTAGPADTARARGRRRRLRPGLPPWPPDAAWAAG